MVSKSSVTQTSYEQQVKDLFSTIGAGSVSSSVYDTAWIAQLGDHDPKRSQQALQWLRENQLPDGSWGTGDFIYNHDRLISTLGAMLALARFGYNGDHARVERAQETLDTWIQGLNEDTAGETIGFELLIPTMIDEGCQLGIIHADVQDTFYSMAAKRTLKLVSLPDRLINRYVTVSFSSEMVGLDAQALLDVERLQEPNGSVAYSPAATAFFAIHVCKGDSAALNYLNQISNPDGSVPTVGPIDIFEISWTLWNLLLVYTPEQLEPLAAPLLDILEQSWIPGRGIGPCSGGALTDGDDSSVVYEVLAKFGRSVDQQAILSYETNTHFKCYPLEANPSISTNIHVLGALRMMGLEADHPSVKKVIKFLKDVTLAKSHWYDKWHVSPYYTTAHALIACIGYTDDRFLTKAAEWIRWTQNTDGSWGRYLPTAEETAYALQAMIIWRRSGGDFPLECVRLAYEWLGQHLDGPYPTLWIGKNLYSPEKVIKGAILSALLLAEQELS